MMTVLKTAIGIAERIAPRVADCTDRNDHTEAMLVITKAFNYQGSTQELTEIKYRSENLGYTTQNDCAKRLHIQHHVLKLIKELSVEAHDLIKGSL